MRKNLLFVFALIFTGIFLSSFKPNSEGVKDKFVVVLDAGHGGKDPGNRGNGYFEKDIALNIILSIGAELEKNPDIKVIYTRKTDVFIPLIGRAEIANKADADLFISVHCNSHSSQASGTETFVLGLRRNEDNMEVARKENSVIYLEEDYKVTYNGFDPNSPESHIGFTLLQEEYLDQSILLAAFVQDNFTNDLKRHNRGVKQDVFLVLRETYMPSVLIETGFLTNNEEGAYLNSKKGQKEMSVSIVDAIEQYRKNINLDVLEVVADLEENPELAANTEINTAEPENDVYENITFKVQLAASSRKLEPKPSNFKGLDKLARTKEGKYYKYYYGATSSYKRALELQEEAKNKGFASSYLVAFLDGKKITVKEALKQK